MRVINNVPLRAVCEYFLKSQTEPFDGSLADDAFFQQMRAYGERHPDNPAVVWLGFSPRHPRPKVQWQLVEEIDVGRIYSEGLNPAWRSVLYSVGKNFLRFVRECSATYGTEYRDTLPADDLSLILGVCHPRAPMDIEMVDGSHRLGSMIILNDAVTVSGYIGRY